jgi:NAD+ synthase
MRTPDKDRIIHFIKETVNSFGLDGAVLGVSGGIDSAVLARLTADALGREHVLGLLLPERDSSPQTVPHAKQVCEHIGIEYKIQSITSILRRMRVYRLQPPSFLVPRRRQERYATRRYQSDTNGDAFLADLRSLGSRRFREGIAYYRTKHRIRMSLFYFWAEKLGYAVVGSTNKTERETGFYVKWGDDSADIEPLLHLYKTEVITLARNLQIPEAIVNKAPSPDLIPGLTDEYVLGLSYNDLDRILSKMETSQDLTGENPDHIQRVETLKEHAYYRDMRNVHL